jgi:hypothetical protein
VAGEHRRRGEKTYHELLLDLAEALKTGAKLKVVVCSRLGNGRDDGDPVSLRADIVRRGNTSNVDVYQTRKSALLS